ncbi:calcium-binding protein P-like [Watersipora subatra]|uniref:calcium-binding protein P-like n=1 Tax=Watersipora subatra TaxID=2589382 RepID=UPI00355C8972
MEYQAFEQLAAKVKSSVFTGSKHDVINKSTGPFTAQQLYRLQGQFMGGSDRVKVISDLSAARRILPMIAKDAEPIIKMGIYTQQKKDLVKLLAVHIADRQNPQSRELLVKSFGRADQTRVFGILDEAGPYQGPPPLASAMGPGATVVTPNAIVTHPAGSHYHQDPISYVAQNAGTALFGGILTANVPEVRPGVQTTVAYQAGPPQPQFGYPQSNQPSQMPQPPATFGQPGIQGPPVTSAQPPLYPAVPFDGNHASAPPPAYSPVDPQSYPPAGVNQYPPQNNIVYPPAGAPQNQELPAKMPLA